MPQVQSELAVQTLKDPYIFDFLTLSKQYKEKDLEDQSVKHITQFLLELGAGFAFVGRQYHLEIGGDDYYIDLLFYHLKLKCYVVKNSRISKYELIKAIPKDLKSNLPTVEEIESEMEEKLK